jgi:hypothetical protein
VYWALGQFSGAHLGIPYILDPESSSARCLPTPDPQGSLKTKKVLGVLALPRWARDPDPWGILSFCWGSHLLLG